MLNLLKPFKQIVILVLLALGFKAMARKDGEHRQKIKQLEEANRALKNQRDVSVSSADDALGVWKELDNRK